MDATEKLAPIALEEVEDVVLVSDTPLSRLSTVANTSTVMGPVQLREKRCWQSFITTAVTLSAAALVIVLYAWSHTIAAARDPVTGRVTVYSFPYFVLCFVGGALAGTAHTVVTPIDVVKCRMQVGEYSSMAEGFRRIFTDAKWSLTRAMPALFRGWVPTFYAYVIQGAIKFGLYEIFKYVLGSAWLADGKGMMDTNGGTAKLAIYLLASSTAEVFADLGLAPFEALKVKLQTTNVYPTDMSSIIPRIWAAEGLPGFYKGLVPLWGRQVPYTMMKFASFEAIVRAFNRLLLTQTTSTGDGGAGLERATTGAVPPSAAAQLAVTLLSGVLAGFLCAIVSHPADTLVSKLNQRGKRSNGTDRTYGGALDGTSAPAAANESLVAMGLNGTHGTSEDGGLRRSGGVESAESNSVIALAKELGWSGLWRGLVPRMAMVGALTSMQWVLYDAFKVAVGLPTTGGGAGGAGGGKAGGE